MEKEVNYTEVVEFELSKNTYKINYSTSRDTMEIKDDDTGESLIMSLGAAEHFLRCLTKFVREIKKDSK